VCALGVHILEIIIMFFGTPTKQLAGKKMLKPTLFSDFSPKKELKLLDLRIILFPIRIQLLDTDIKKAKKNLKIDPPHP
jgi:hypothetical protein